MRGCGEWVDTLWRGWVMAREPLEKVTQIVSKSMFFALPTRQITFGRTNPATTTLPASAAATVGVHSLNHKNMTGYCRHLPLPMPLQDLRSLQYPFHSCTPTATAVEGIVPDIVTMVDTDSHLDLKAIALHPRNAKYNPQVRIDHSVTRKMSNCLSF
ncbi:uncharacterized protein LACBIDRAFT_302248 [Laccaria bicolor S238N-H82]|uniref:Predicted protein n=1 Tax=Laccaria bicolor (strain S238N-H82 / ATCC MYA-4686) TaxID=486041 RepID=B0DHE2_LACBS|nr:uncharacterized protein LACBIDRAFT_302248 [Laccaria bicolor S238N-H82]EDR06093.1 predicted protein [Laccaria bicolor S238N-H82]|eukprot:XP_001883381.1 predicted protein [Laccaria bicolor S238N-H82]